MLAEVILKIYGDVQGVGFRYSTVRQAQLLTLTGFVRNLPDGSVEILAQGEKENLEKLIAWTKKGPYFAEVEKIEATWKQPEEKFQEFEIRY